MTASKARVLDHARYCGLSRRGQAGSPSGGRQPQVQLFQLAFYSAREQGRHELGVWEVGWGNVIGIFAVIWCGSRELLGWPWRAGGHLFCTADPLLGLL